MISCLRTSLTSIARTVAAQCCTSLLLSLLRNTTLSATLKSRLRGFRFNPRRSGRKSQPTAGSVPWFPLARNGALVFDRDRSGIRNGDGSIDFDKLFGYIRNDEMVDTVIALPTGYVSYIDGHNVLRTEPLSQMGQSDAPLAKVIDMHKRIADKVTGINKRIAGEI